MAQAQDFSDGHGVDPERWRHGLAAGASFPAVPGEEHCFSPDFHPDIVTGRVRKEGQKKKE
jgi:hypothetical protein